MYLLLKMKKLYCATFAHPKGSTDPQKYCIPKESCYLVVSIHLTCISQIGSFPQIGVKRKHI